MLLLLPPLLLSRTDLKGTMSLFFSVFFVTFNVASKILLSCTDLKGTGSLFFSVFFESKCTQNDAVVVTFNVASKKLLSLTDLRGCSKMTSWENPMTRGKGVDFGQNFDDVIFE